jgi:hypothetical protein
VTPKQLLALADDYDRQADEAHARGDMAAMLELFAAATELRAAAEARGRLQVSNQPVSVGAMANAVVTRSARRRMSRAKTTDPLALAADASGHTLRSLAKAVGMSHVTMIQARRGERRIRQELAEKIAEITGFAATRKHWPLGWSGE